MRTRPRVRVVLPAAESPTTPSMVGRGTALAPLVVPAGEDAALQQVLRLDRHQLVAPERRLGLEQPARLAQARPVDRVADAAAVREARPPPPALDVLAKHLPRFRREAIRPPLEHQVADSHQLLDG